MREGWKTYLLGDISGFRYGKMPNKELSSDAEKYPIFSGYKNSGYYQEFNCEGNQLIVVARGVGGTGDVKITKENCWLTNLSIEFLLDSKYVDKVFLYYYFLKDTLRHLDSGSAQSQITIDDLRRTEITIPPLPIQGRIATLLSSLDEKIELNRQANQTLKSIAQALFKEWFVDFNFPGSTGEMQESELGPIPVGWRVYKLEELIDTVSITHKFDKDEVVFLNTSDIESGKVLNHNYSKVKGLPGQAKKSIRKLDILFTEIRPANKRFALIDFDADDYVVSTKLMVLRTKVDIHPIVIYNYLTSDEILNWLQHLAESRSGTFPQITFSQVKELKIALPIDDLLNAYVNIAWPAFEVVSNCDGETKALVEIRDSLLPKLMNGEIEV